MRRQGLCRLICFITSEGIQEMKPQSVDRIDPKGQGGKSAVEEIAMIIRGKSQSGKLVSLNEIFQELLDRNLLKADEAQNLFEIILEKALEENEDLGKLHTEGEEPCFFSSQFMSESYARILVQKESNPMLLIAEIVRENSDIYPRPVSLDAFRNSPFDLTQEEIQAYLNQMAKQDEYKDIQQTTTSIGTVFLYSTLHLDPGYASMLAEWLDVGQVDNP
jgi:hypothetical protein